MKTANLLLAIMAGLVIITTSCNKEELEDTIKKDQISGVVQKGPFNVGTSITLNELNEDLSQTGKSFSTQIDDDNGTFELNNIALASQYVKLSADGFYFNETSGENSSARLALNALSNVKDRTTLNVNVLSHLEKPRVEYLISNGSTFAEAKATALQEILQVFNMNGASIGESESLNFTEAGEGNAMLLAISSILQGYRSVSDLSELLTYIANDLKEDGTLDDTNLQTSLISHALYVDTDVVKQNLSDKYNAEGISVELPEFGQYVEQFIDNSSFTTESLIDYPEQSTLGLNMLNENNNEFLPGRDYNYSLAAQTTEGLSLKIELRVIEGEVEMSGWGYRTDYINWKISTYDTENHIQTFELIDETQPADVKISIREESGYKIQITYFEGNNVRTRVITIQ